MNFEDIKIGYTVFDKDSKLNELVTDKTSSSIEISQTARTVEGVNCKQWFIDKDFDKRFILKLRTL